MARRFDLLIPQGEDWSLTVPVLDASGQPLALTGYTARAQARDPYSDALLHTWTVAGGNMTLSTNLVTLTVSAATSTAWAWQLARWDLELTAPNGAVTRLVEGAALVDPEITI